MRRSITSTDRPTLLAVLGVLVLTLVAVALVPMGSASALPPAVPTGKPTEEPIEDFIPPTISFPMPAGGHNGWFNGTTVLEVSAEDTGAGATGVSTFTYRLTGATIGNGNLNPVGDVLTISNGGQTTVYLEATDGNGNMDTSQRVIGVDRDMPTLSITTPTHMQEFRLGAQATVSFSCTDPLTGIRVCGVSNPNLDTSSLGQKSVTFTATDNVGNTRSQSVTYQVVDNVWEATTYPALAGPAKVGTTLTVTPGVYEPAPTGRSYVWFRDGEVIPGVTGTSYLLTAEDEGAELYVEESISRDQWPTWVYGTNMVDPILLGDLAEVTAPRVSGTARVGSVLTASAAELEPSPTTVTYRWTRDGVAIPGATGMTYRLVAADAGKRVRVEAVAARAGYASLTSTSAPTAAVAAAPKGTDAQGRQKPTVVAKVKALKKGKARVTVTVTVPKGAKPGGTVTVKRGKKTLASNVAVKAGKARVVVKKLPKGKKVRLVVAYSGTTEVAAATAKSKRFTVR